MTASRIPDRIRRFSVALIVAIAAMFLGFAVYAAVVGRPVDLLARLIVVALAIAAAVVIGRPDREPRIQRRLVLLVWVLVAASLVVHALALFI